ncbi:MAG: GHMP kinase, partial [Candidatus Latescibacterota bacterium]
GGGFLLLYVPRHKHDDVRKVMEEIGLRELPFMLERDGSKVIFNIRRYPTK